MVAPQLVCFLFCSIHRLVTMGSGVFFIVFSYCEVHGIFLFK